MVNFSRMLGFAAMYGAVQAASRILTPHLVPKYNTWAPQKRIKWDIYVVCFFNSLMLSLPALYLLLFPNEAVQKDPTYGLDERTQTLFCLASGFFLYDLGVCIYEKYGVDMFAHALLCMLCYVFGQHPFLPRMGTVCLLFELSTPFLNARHLLSLLEMDSSPMHGLMTKLFGLVFSIVRIGYGVPMSFWWWRDEMLPLLRNTDGLGRLHSLAQAVFFLVANLALNGLNLFWAYLILLKAIKKKKT